MSLTNKTITSTAWSTGGMLVGQGLNLLRLAILARLLTPEDFGVYAMVMVFYMFLTNAGDLGSSAVIVQRRELTRSLLGTVFWLNVGFGALLGLVVFALAPAIGALYGEPRVSTLLAWMAVLFPVSALGYVHGALLRRELRFKRLTGADLAANAISSVASVYLAWRGFGYFAFGFQVISHALIYTSLLWLATRYRPAMVFDRDDFRSILGFSANLTAFNFVDYAAANADKFLVGKFLGSTSLGAYYLGFRLILMPMRQINASVKNVVFPAMARVQDDPARLRSVFLRFSYLLTAVAAPGVVLFSVTADLVTETLFGPAWREAAGVLAVLAPAGLLQLIASPCGILCLLKERTDLMLKLSLLGLALIPLSVFVGLRWGTVGAAAGYTVSALLLLAPSLFFVLRLAGITLGDFFGSLSRPLLAAFAAAVVVFGLRAALPSPEGGLAPALELALCLAAGGAIYALTVGRALLREVASMRSAAAAQPS